MSKRLTTLVYSKTCGGQTRKAVLVAMADRANDDGSGVWVSKTRMAAEIEITRQTVFYTVRELVAEGVLIDRGKRAGKRGYTIEYDIAVKKIMAFPESWPETEDFEVCESPESEASSETTQSQSVASIVSHKAGNSVTVNSKNRPYRTKNNPSDFSKKKTPRTSSSVLWEANRWRSTDPERAKELEAEADELVKTEMARERELAESPPKRLRKRRA